MRYIAIGGFIKRSMNRLPVALIAVLPLAAFVQTASRPEEQLESETANRIATLDKRFGELLKETTESEKQWAEACSSKGCQAAAPGVQEEAEKSGVERDKAMNAVASQIHGEVDTHITRAARPDHVDPGAIEQSLKRILGKTAWGPTSAFVTSVNRTPSLVVAYTLAKAGSMGEGATSVTVRVYAAVQGHFRLVAATGGDMDGYANVSLVELHAPILGEMWILLSGYMTGANGPNNQIRVYAYDGTNFRAVWGPDDNWGDFTVRATDRGFSVDGPYYTAASGKDPEPRHDVYLLAEDGVHRVSP
jgi:hypothetical protein